MWVFWSLIGSSLSLFSFCVLLLVLLYDQFVFVSSDVDHYVSADQSFVSPVSCAVSHSSSVSSSVIFQSACHAHSHLFQISAQLRCFTSTLTLKCSVCSPHFIGTLLVSMPRVRADLLMHLLFLVSFYCLVNILILVNKSIFDFLIYCRVCLPISV